MAEKKAPKAKATTKEKAPAWKLVQGEGCWLVSGKNLHHFDTKEKAEQMLAKLLG